MGYIYIYTHTHGLDATSHPFLCVNKSEPLGKNSTALLMGLEVIRLFVTNLSWAFLSNSMRKLYFWKIQHIKSKKRKKKSPHLLADFAIVGTHETACLNQPEVLHMQECWKKHLQSPPLSHFRKTQGRTKFVIEEGVTKLQHGLKVNET